jgi:hypothetical protein
MAKRDSASQVLQDYFRVNYAKFPRKWSLFFARYKFVSEIVGLELASSKGMTARGYEIGLKLAMAHTALEALKNALGLDHPIVLKHKNAAKLVRNLCGSDFEAYLVETAKSKGLKDRLTAMFASKKIMDIGPLVEAIRNLVFHGSFTPKSAGLTRSSEIRLLLDLAYHVALDVIDDELEAYCRKLAI